MVSGNYRIGIVGASSLMGRELADALSESALGGSSFVLLDDEDLTGTVTAAGDEVALIQKLDESSFDGLDLVFFTGRADVAQAQIAGARMAGATVIDLTYATNGKQSAEIWAPRVDEALGEGTRAFDLTTSFVVAAHPGAIMLALVVARLMRLKLTHISATMIEPASEHGRPAMDELQQQTVSLLSFQPLQKEQYDAQVTFNVLPELGAAAKINLETVARRIVQHYDALGRGRLPALALQLVQAPVFHGYTASVMIDLKQPATAEQIEAALSGVHVSVVTGESAPPSNLSAAGQEDLLVRVRAAGGEGRRFWIWMAADNLKLHALNAVACAIDLTKLRPTGTVQ